MIDGPLRNWPRAFGPDQWVRVLAQTTSTQDAARALASSTQQRIFIAARQTRGRGSRGRAWSDRHGLGLAMTISFPASSTANGPLDAGILPLACGLAAIDAITRLCGKHSPRLGLKWPNDVVQVDASGRGVRKLGGILIEAAQGCLFAGIGINVHQQEADFEPSLRRDAVSLRQLGVHLSRPVLGAAIVASLAGILEASPQTVLDRWKQHDALRGARGSFEHNLQTFIGTVLHIEPTRSIELRLADGQTVSLPAATTVRIRPHAAG
ncbi:MAG: biotin--[acetyl-CoA-carboxylase] ligase [Planctomycetota bacterium]|nr:biotin--[acetyl-CoA-carboxylase] ligase [Planctomycetota bacterium]